MKQFLAHPMWRWLLMAGLFGLVAPFAIWPLLLFFNLMLQFVEFTGVIFGLASPWGAAEVGSGLDPWLGDDLYPRWPWWPGLVTAGALAPRLIRGLIWAPQAGRRTVTGVPLLVKELIEQAARPRTYVARMVYTLLLFLTWGLFALEMFEHVSHPLDVLGQGKNLFYMLVALQFTGIFLFLPAMMCGAISDEKQRDTLELLLVTDLRPWEVVIQKLLGRLVPMFTFLLLSLPLLAVSYTYGGVTRALLWEGVGALLLTCFQVGALCLMFSAYCRSTVVSLLASYLTGIGLYFGPSLVVMMVMTASGADSYDPGFELLYACSYLLNPPVVFAGGQWAGFAPGFLPPSVQAIIFGPGRYLPILMSTLVFLWLARRFLVERAAVPPTNATRIVFEYIDRFMNDTNALFGSITLVKDRGSLPADQPVLWYEIHRRALGKFRYLLRLLLVIMVPLLLFAKFLRTTNGPDDAIAVVLVFFWPLGGLMLVASCVNVMVAERAHQTLDVLLTTPLTGREIIRQKVAALSRLALILAIPLLTIYLLRFRSAYPQFGYHHDPEAYVYLVGSVLSVLVYLPLVAWVSILIALWVGKPGRAIITTLSVLVGWCIAPIIVAAWLIAGVGLEEGYIRPFMLLSPMGYLGYSEAADLEEIFSWKGAWRNWGRWAAMVVNFGFYGAIALAARWVCLTYADRLLGRGHAS